MEQCRKHGLSMEAVIRANEEVIRSREVIDDSLDHIWSVMSMCIDRGLNAKGCLPGPLKVKRRANELYEKLLNSPLKVAEIRCRSLTGSTLTPLPSAKKMPQAEELLLPRPTVQPVLFPLSLTITASSFHRPIKKASVRSY